MIFIHQDWFGWRFSFQNVGGKILGQTDEFVRGEYIGYLNSFIETDDIGNRIRFDPDQEKGASNTHHGGGGSYLKIFLFELQQVFGKYPDFSEIHLEGCGPFLFFGIKFKLIQVEIGLSRPW